MFLKAYSEEWIFFRRTLFRTFLVLSILCVVTITMSYDHYRRHPEKLRTKFSQLTQSFQDYHLGEKRGIKGFVKLFLNNFLACFQTAALGFVPFLFLPVVRVIELSIPAGLVIVANEAFRKQDIFSLIVTRLLPHGIFELPAAMYASSIGVYLTKEITRKLIPRYRRNALPFRNLCMQAGRSFLQVVVPLLLIAALVQVFITPK